MDGFDLSGTNIHIHDYDVWNQDDTFAMKAESETTSNVLIENVRASGVGLTIGSIGRNDVRTITFRNVITVCTIFRNKGMYVIYCIYMKLHIYINIPL